MAFVTGYTYDVFISYDSQSQNMIDWMEQFHEELKNDLKNRLKTEVEICKKEKMDDNLSENHIKSSAIFLSIISKGYLNSEKYEQELCCFHDSIKGSEIEEKKRIIGILLDNSAESSTEQFNDAYSISLYSLSGNESFETLNFERESFKREFRKLAGDISNTLKSLQSLSTADKADESQTPIEPCDVFFADVAGSKLQKTRHKVSHKLAEQNKKVYNKIYDNIPPPDKPIDKHDLAVISAMKNSKTSVHLMGDDEGNYIDLDTGEETYTQRQVTLGCKNNTFQIIWLPLDIEDKIENGKYKDYLKKLEEQAVKTNGRCRFIRGNNDTKELISIINDRIDELKKNSERTDVPSAVLLDIRPQEKEAFAEQINRLSLFLKSQDIELIFNEKDDYPSLEENLKQAGAFIIFYSGMIDKDKVFFRLCEVAQVVFSKHYPVKVLCSYLAKNDDVNHPLLKLILLKDPDIEPNSFIPLLTALNIRNN